MLIARTIVRLRPVGRRDAAASFSSSSGGGSGSSDVLVRILKHPESALGVPPPAASKPVDMSRIAYVRHVMRYGRALREEKYPKMRQDLWRWSSAVMVATGFAAATYPLLLLVGYEIYYENQAVRQSKLLANYETNRFGAFMHYNELLDRERVKYALGKDVEHYFARLERRKQLFEQQQLRIRANEMQKRQAAQASDD